MSQAIDRSCPVASIDSRNSSTNTQRAGKLQRWDHSDSATSSGEETESTLSIVSNTGSDTRSGDEDFDNDFPPGYCRLRGNEDVSVITSPPDLGASQTIRSGFSFLDLPDEAPANPALAVRQAREDLEASVTQLRKNVELHWDLFSQHLHCGDLARTTCASMEAAEQVSKAIAHAVARTLSVRVKEAAPGAEEIKSAKQVLEHARATAEKMAKMLCMVEKMPRYTIVKSIVCRENKQLRRCSTVAMQVIKRVTEAINYCDYHRTAAASARVQVPLLVELRAMIFVRDAVVESYNLLLFVRRSLTTRAHVHLDKWTTCNCSAFPDAAAGLGKIAGKASQDALGALARVLCLARLAYNRAW